MQILICLILSTFLVGIVIGMIDSNGRESIKYNIKELIKTTKEASKGFNVLGSTLVYIISVPIAIGLIIGVVCMKVIYLLLIKKY